MSEDNQEYAEVRISVPKELDPKRQTLEEATSLWKPEWDGKRIKTLQSWGFKEESSSYIQWEDRMLDFFLIKIPKTVSKSLVRAYNYFTIKAYELGYNFPLV